MLLGNGSCVALDNCSCIILPSPIYGLVPPASDLHGLKRSIRFKDISHIPMGQGNVLFCMEQNRPFSRISRATCAEKSVFPFALNISRTM
ncbi:protein of unknown function [Shewanella benthica]|uniref:Uncharacterized protein n=1 Tax=Shewanella benthica TaxID=43661 RepID=A0A330M518_9GAMM|nr:protein of unknown function [Shewanella benthica]